MDSVEQVTLSVELLRAAQHVHKVAQRVDDDEGNEKDGRADGALAVVVQCELEVAREKDGLQCNFGNIEQQENEGAKNTWDAAIAFRCRRFIIGRSCRRWSSGTTTSHLAHLLHVLEVLLHSSWLVDHLPFLSCIFSQISHDSLLSTRVYRNPLGDIDGLTEKDDPCILFFVVLLNFRDGNTVPTTSASGHRSSSTTTAANLANLLQVLHVLLDSARLVNHLPLFSGVLPQVGFNGLFSARMDWNPLADIIDFAEEDDPTICFGLVLGNLFQADTSICRSCSSSRSSRGTARLKIFHILEKLILRHLLWLLLHLSSLDR
mmetsp:Transcript_49518/g.88950  ORF Transcript_49518/g.88950 Transcript_49518/m.88950 type:complete len:319 (-) Transcript_49518:1397-2353(-)